MAITQETVLKFTSNTVPVPGQPNEGLTLTSDISTTNNQSIYSDISVSLQAGGGAELLSAFLPPATTGSPTGTSVITNVILSYACPTPGSVATLDMQRHDGTSCKILLNNGAVFAFTAAGLGQPDGSWSADSTDLSKWTILGGTANGTLRVVATILSLT